IAAARPLTWSRSRYSGRPPNEVSPVLERSASYWKPRTPCGSIPHPVGDGSRFANADYLPDLSGPTGNLTYLGAGFRLRSSRHGRLVPAITGGGPACHHSAGALPARRDTGLQPTSHIEARHVAERLARP